METKHNHKTQQIQFIRINGAPLIEPDPSLDWEAGGVFSPAVIHETKDIWKMLYRAYGNDKISRLGYAESSDGIKWQKSQEPRVIPDASSMEYSGTEDPRIVKIDNRYLITYTAYADKKRFVKTRIRILETTDFQNFKRITPAFQDHWRKNDKDGVLFPEKIDYQYLMLHRMEPDIQISSSTNLRRWSRHITILKPTAHEWEAYKIGAGAPPLRTAIGWLIIYHGVSKTFQYSMGAAILDINSPTRVLYRLPFSILEPDLIYEKNGVVANVVFGTSVIELVSDYCLYYGAGDKVIAAALINKSDLLKTLLQYPV
jgi:predicted GH43/DUF377 family glycosyl hydrolase